MNFLLNLSPFLILAAIVWLVLRAKTRFRQATLIAADAQAVENLVDLAAYDVDETGYWARLPWLSGLVFGVFAAIVELVLPIPHTRYSPLISAVMSIAIGGPLFGLLFPALMRRRVRMITARLYAGERRIIDPPPANFLVRYQIPCAWINGRESVGGVLYLGCGGLLFVPHKLNRRPRPPVEMTPIHVLKIMRVAPVTGNVIQRLLMPHPQEQIKVTWNCSSACFLMPNPVDTFVKLGRCLEALQAPNIGT